MTVLFSIRERGRFGFIDQRGRVVISPVLQNEKFYSHYEGAVDFSDWVPIKQGNAWGCIDAKGKQVLAPAFAMLERFSEDFAPFGEPIGKSYGVTDYKWGYVDRAGKVRIAAQFAWAIAFEKRLAAVALPGKDGSFSRWSAEWALIDKKGAIRSRGYEDLFDLQEGRRLAQKKSKWGYLDAEGKEIIRFVFEEANGFRGGRARVVQKKKHAVIDLDGEVLFWCKAKGPWPENAWAKQQFYTDFIAEGFALDYDGKKWGFLDAEGAITVDYAYDDAAGFSEGLAAVKVGKKWGYVDRRGNSVIPAQFDEASEFREGRAHAKVKVKVGGKSATRYGFIDQTGAMVIAAQFTKADERPVFFQNGLAAVVKDKKRQYIDADGNVVWSEP